MGRSRFNYHILLFWPNIIGYIRLFLITCMIISISAYFICACLFYLLSTVLDFFDGAVARSWNQTSRFGAQIDVIIDIMGRGFLWVYLSPYFFFIPCIEWIVFSATSKKGKFWKDQFSSAPSWVQNVMANNFRTFLGMITMTGVDFLPLFLLTLQTDKFAMIPSVLQFLLFSGLLIGRLLSAAVEIYIIIQHFEELLDDNYADN